MVFTSGPCGSHSRCQCSHGCSRPDLLLVVSGMQLACFRAALLSLPFLVLADFVAVGLLSPLLVLVFPVVLLILSILCWVLLLWLAWVDFDPFLHSSLSSTRSSGLRHLACPPARARLRDAPLLPLCQLESSRTRRWKALVVMMMIRIAIRLCWPVGRLRASSWYS